MLGTCVKISYHSQLIAPLSKQLAQLPASRSTIYARVNFAQSLIEIKEPQVEQFLKDTVRQSQVLEDDIAQAYAIGVLGHWLEIQHKDKQDAGIYRSSFSLS